ncbi:DUF1634 domain-containing protein [Microbacterium luticocti]|uniref:DUF1634 domain-containing protein n=1 Tax=Microbacterium luticocti TaxID=451764 RepID=UPI0003FDD95B|nr:DUF1634 domain-containing protein [Microbacterium luticocti]
MTGRRDAAGRRPHGTARIERVLAVWLRVGVATATVLLVLGWVCTVAPGILARIGQAGVIAGIAVLVLLPVGRLLILAGAFARHREHGYLAVTGVVLALTAATVVVALAVSG